MKLSIITINYNNLEGLRKTIESVVNQTWRDFEYIIIDGGSTDGSLDVIKEYSDKIDYWVSEPDRGVYHAMNKGIDVANSEYCIFINSGDCLYCKETLSLIATQLDVASIIVGTLHLDTGEEWLAPREITLPYLYESSLPHPASFIKTSLLKKYHYDEELRIVSDWKFWVQILLMDGESYSPLDQIVSIFDTSGISMSNVELAKKERIHVLENEFSPIIFKYFKKTVEGYDAQLYNLIRESKYRSIFYMINVSLIKLFCAVNRKSWGKRFPFKLDM